MEKCDSVDCSHVCYCQKSNKCIDVTKETKKGIANSVAHIICSDYRIFSMSSLLESDGSRLEALVRDEQSSKGFAPCFKAPY